MLVELVNTELQACAPRLDEPDANCTAPTSNKFCTYCHKRGHVRRRCYHATRACFECGSPDHFVKKCPLKRTLSFLTDPVPNLDSGSKSDLSVTSKKSSRQRNSSEVLDRANVGQFYCSRFQPIPYSQFNNSKVRKSEAASVLNISSTNVSPFLRPFASECSFSAGQSLCNQATSTSFNCGSVNIPGVSSQMYSCQETTIPDISAGPAGGLRSDQPSFPASGSGTANVNLASACGFSSGEVTLRASLPDDSVVQFGAPSVSPIASVGETTSGSSFAVPAVTAAVVSPSDTDTTSAVSSSVLTTAITSTVPSTSPISLVTSSVQAASISQYSPLVSLPTVGDDSAKSHACSDSIKSTLSPLSRGPYKRTITRISSRVQSSTSSISTSSSVVSSGTCTSINTGTSIVRCNASRNCLHLYKNAKTCREYVAVEVMERGETLCQYATRFTGALRNAFPDVKTDTRRDLIDRFIEGLQRTYILAMLDLKDEKCVKTSRTPFATFVSRILADF